MLISNILLTLQEKYFQFSAQHNNIKKVKESRNRPGVAQRVPGDLGFQIFITFGTRRW
jgi:hypothetical protein